MAVVGRNVERAGRLLSAGYVVGVPTETVYGLAANALDTSAVAEIFRVKERPHYNPLIIHLGSRADLEKYVSEVPPLAEKLIRKFWPGPLTLLLPKKANVPDLVTAGLPHVAVRVPDHPLMRQLLQQLDFPLAAPSANPFCHISPTKAAHVQQQIGGKIPYILDGDACQAGLESTIVGFEGDDVVLYRLGAITPEQLEAVVGQVRLHEKTGKEPLSPGMLPYHYAPDATLYLTEDLEDSLRAFDVADTGIITFHKLIMGVPEAQQVVLSPAGDLEEAARNLYDALHQLDNLRLTYILAEKMPDFGLGKTMNERLQKAAGKKLANAH